jgi:putative two-component system response regulator
MPHVDGFVVLRLLRGARISLGYMPVMVLTGYETLVARNTALILGADEFLMKPVDRQEIILRVRNLLHTREVYVAAREGHPD